MTKSQARGLVTKGYSPPGPRPGLRPFAIRDQLLRKSRATEKRLSILPHKPPPGPSRGLVQQQQDRFKSHRHVARDDARLANQIGDGCRKHGVESRDFPLLLQHQRERQAMLFDLRAIFFRFTTADHYELSLRVWSKPWARSSNLSSITFLSFWLRLS